MKDHEFTDIIRNCIFPMLDDLIFCRKPQRSERERETVLKKQTSPYFSQQDQSQQGQQLAVLRSCLRRLIDGTIQAATLGTLPRQGLPGFLRGQICPVEWQFNAEQHDYALVI